MPSSSFLCGRTPKTKARAKAEDKNKGTEEQDLCVFCNTVPGIYKCPKCEQKTCSAVCSRTHRDGHGDDKEAPKPQLTLLDVLEANKDPHDDGFGCGLRFLYQKYPHLRHNLIYLADLAEAMRQGQPSASRPKDWTPDQGMDDAREGLRRLRSGPHREAIDEFAELVNWVEARQQCVVDDADAAYPDEAERV